MGLLQGIEHRMNLLETTHADLHNTNIKLSWDTNELDRKISDELQLLKKETKDLLAECEIIRKRVFALGSLLKEKATKQELIDFENKVHEWPTHEYFSFDELKHTFEKYAKR